MKRKLALLFMMVSAAVATASAAEPQMENEYLEGNFWSHWYVSAGVGAEFHFLENEVGNFDEFKTSPTFNVSLGKWINPYIGVRAQYSLSWDKGTISAPNYFTGTPDKFKGNLSQLHADAMFNISSIIGGYKADRFYELYPYAGIAGGIFTSSLNDGLEREVMLKVGLVNNFRLSDNFSAVIEASYLHNNGVIYGMPLRQPKIYPVDVTIGVTYHFGGREFNSTDDIYEANRLAMIPLQKKNDQLLADNKELKSQVNTLSGDIDDLESDVAKANAKIAELESQNKLISVPAFFHINSYRVSNEHKGTFKYAAEDMKANPSKKYVVYGYADSATGSVKYNERLAQNRAEAIVDVLVNDYGVAASQVRAQGMGGVDNIFEDSKLNRCVILKGDN